MYTKGNHLPVVTDINLINPIGTLADGRPIYSTTVSAATRMDPRFNHILVVQSLGESAFKSMTSRRQALRQGLTFNVQYTLGKGIDNTPLRTQLTVQAEAGPFGSEQPRARQGAEPARHPAQPQRQHRLHVAAATRRTRSCAQLLDGNQIGVLLQFNSGLPVNIIGNARSERDGVATATVRSTSRATRSICRRARTSTCATRGGSRFAARCAARSSPR